MLWFGYEMTVHLNTWSPTGDNVWEGPGAFSFAGGNMSLEVSLAVLESSPSLCSLSIS